jgi:hypothetical protein
MRHWSTRRRPDKEASTSFFEKKEAKKLLLLGAWVFRPQASEQKSFAELFFRKATSF